MNVLPARMVAMLTPSAQTPLDPTAAPVIQPTLETGQIAYTTVSVMPNYCLSFSRYARVFFFLKPQRTIG